MTKMLWVSTLAETLADVDGSSRAIEDGMREFEATRANDAILIRLDDAGFCPRIPR